MTRTVRRWVRYGAIGAVTVLLGQAVVAVTVCINPHRGSRPRGAAIERAAVDAGGIAEVTCFAADGVAIRGELLGDAARRPVVVFGHGFRGLRRQGDPLALALLERGYAVLLFDFRGSGASDGAITSIGALEDRDLAAVLRHLDSVLHVPPARTAYVGSSMGAAAALLAPERTSRLAAVVLMAPYASLVDAFDVRTRKFTGLPTMPWFAPAAWMIGLLIGRDPAGVIPADHAADLAPAPLLFLGGTADWRVPPDQVREVHDRALDPKRLVLLEGIDHIELGHFGADVRAPILEFLAETLPPAE